MWTVGYEKLCDSDHRISEGAFDFWGSFAKMMTRSMRRRAQNRDNEKQKERKRKANTTPAKETADTPPTEADTVHPHNKTEKTRDDTVHGNPREERVDDTTNVKQVLRRCFEMPPDVFASAREGGSGF